MGRISGNPVDVLSVEEEARLAELVERLGLGVPS
jgi:hypothetical protein